MAKKKKPTATELKRIKLSKFVRREAEVDTILVSISGGRSSAMMGRLMQLNPRYKDKNLVYMFANTGKEREETFQFVQDCDDAFGWNTIWVESIVDPRMGKGVRAKEVDFNTATRLGAEYTGLGAVMDKLDIPNPEKVMHCTRDSKVRAMDNQMSVMGYSKKDYVTAIGIRYNEPKRLTFDPNKIYPLADFCVDELSTRQFWKKQSFDLQLQDYQGNCTLCFQKSKDKNKQHMADLIAMGKEDEIHWWIDKEEASPAGYRFTRGYIKLRDMYNEVKAGDYEPVVDRFHGRDVLAEPLAYDHNKLFPRKRVRAK